MNFEKILEIASVAQQAGLITLKYFRTNAGVNIKKDGSPVTVADIEAEEFIVSYLMEMFPNIPAVGEESFFRGVALKMSSKHWLIDPIDGTAEFIQGRDEYTVNIALVQDGVPILGVIHAPALGTTYLGSMSSGAFRLSGNKLVKIPDVKCSAMVALASRSYFKGRDEMVTMRIPDASVHRLGSSLKFCFLAEGRAAFYPREGKTMHWDTAAGHAILNAAGGSIIDWKTGEELKYLNDSFENPSFLAFRLEYEKLLRESISYHS